jgi:hypothetical protein
VSWGTESLTGSFGRHKFAARDEVAAFNSEVTEWFLKRGFSRVTNETFDVIVRGDEWKKRGLLLCSRDRPGDLIYVFIPECYHPESNVQIIGYHVDFEGSADDLARDRDDLDNLRTEFLRRFPASADVSNGQRGGVTG